MDIIIASINYQAGSIQAGVETKNVVSNPKDDEETEAADDLREIRTSDDIDEPDPEDTDLWPLETDDPDIYDDEDDED